jgi:hypothetical protein
MTLNKNEDLANAAIYAASKYRELATCLIQDIAMRDDIPVDIKAEVLACLEAEQEARHRLKVLTTAHHFERISCL